MADDVPIDTAGRDLESKPTRSAGIPGSGHLSLTSAAGAAVLLVELVLICLGLVRGVHQPVYSNGDEGYHLDYVVKVWNGHLPVVGKSLVDPRVLAVGQHRYPGPPKLPPARAGFGGNSYEGVQPPLYYAIAAPFSALDANWYTKVKILRWLSVAFIAIGIGLLVPLCRRITGNRPLVALTAALLPFTFRGFSTQLVRVGNDALLVPLVIATTYCLLRAAQQRSVPWLAGGSACACAAFLTKNTAPGLLVVAAAVGLMLIVGGRRTVRRAALVVLAVGAPMLPIVGWLAINWHNYHALTGTSVLVRIELPISNPHHIDYTIVSAYHAVPNVLASTVVGQISPAMTAWAVQLGRIVGSLFYLACIVPLAVLRRRYAAALTWTPFVITVAVLIAGAMSENLPVFHSRLLVAWLPVLAITPTLAIPHRAGPRAVAIGTVGLLAIAGAIAGAAALP